MIGLRRLGAATLALGLAGAGLALTPLAVSAHDISTVAGTVNCSGDYSITATGDVYGGVSLIVDLGGTTIEDIAENGTSNASQVFGPFTGTGATAGEAISAAPNDGGSGANGELVADPESCVTPLPKLTVSETCAGLVSFTGSAVGDGFTLYGPGSPWNWYMGTTANASGDGSISGVGPGVYEYAESNSSYPDGVVQGDVTITACPTTITTQTVPGSPVTIGTSVYDTATISWPTTEDVAATADTVGAEGTISYDLYNNSSCSSSDMGLVDNLTPTPDTVTDGSVPNSEPYTFNSAGTWYFQATYSYDDGSSVSSACTSEEIVVNLNTPSITTQTEPGSPVEVGTEVHDTAKLSGATANAGGTVTYGLYSDSSCSDLVKDLTPTDNTVTDGSVPDSRPYTFNSAGTWYFRATYSGDSNNAGPVSSSCRSEELMVKPAPAITTKLSTSSLVLGFPVDAPGQVRDTITVTGEPDVNGFDVYVHLYKESGTPPTRGANSIATWVVPLDSNGMATTPWYMPESAGTFCFMASFKGDANDTPVSTSTCEVLTVTKFPASLTTVPTSPSPTGLVTTVSDTADMTIYPTMPAEGGSGDYGTVVFSLYSDPGCHDVVPGGVTSPEAIGYNGTAFQATGTLSFSSALAPGTYYWIGAYGGNYDNLPYTSRCGEPIVVSAFSPSITTKLSSGTAAAGGSVTDTARLSGATSGATGSITINLYPGNTAAACKAGPALSSSTAGPATDGDGTYSATFSSLAAGSYELQAVYAGDPSKDLTNNSLCGSELLTVGGAGVGGAGGGVLAASTTTPITGAGLFGPGLAGAIALLFGGLMVLVGRRLLRVRAR